MYLDEAAEKEPALAHSGRLDKIELSELKVLDVHLLAAEIVECAVLLRCCEEGWNLHFQLKRTGFTSGFKL